jgi:iron complex outermembrane receptor protein
VFREKYLIDLRGQMNLSVFKLSPVAAGCAVFMALASHAAYAQDSTTSTQDAAATGASNSGITTVKVTGIRRGIEAAISVKKNNDSIVEAISAEDIGKLPDQSIAESLARLPGVTTQRDVHGNASIISIRGMSGDFSTGLLNGREQVSTGDSRSIEFDQYPGELLSGVVVYKTPDAGVVGQGLSGTVDMQTVRPLDFKGRTMAVNYRREKSGLGLDYAKGSGNRFTWSYIDQFADRTVGIAFGFARLQGTGPANSRFNGWGGGTATYNGQTVNVPQNGAEGYTETYRQARNGFMGVVQFRPNREFSSTVDLFYSAYDRSTRNVGIQMPLNDTGSTLYDKPSTLVNPVISGSDVQSGSVNNVRPIIRNDNEVWNDRTRSVGWNNKLKLNQDWTASLDLSFNDARREGVNLETYASTAANNLTTIGFARGSLGYTSSVDLGNPANVVLTDPQGWGGADIQAGYVKFPHVYDRLGAVRFDVSRDLPDGWAFNKFSAGVNVSNRSKTRSYVEGLLSIKGGTDPYATAPVPAGSSSVVAGLTGINVVSYDPVAALNSVYNVNSKHHPDIYNKDWVVREKVDTAFTKLGIDTQAFGIPLRGSAGLQYIHTQQESTAFSVDKTQGSDDLHRPTTSVTDGTSYNDVLPSMNLIGDLGNQQALRFSLEKIMARPQLQQMRASGSFGYDASKGILSGSGGNPSVKPFRAKGADLSYEKYWDSQAYVSAAVFYRKLDSYIINTDAAVDFTPYLVGGYVPVNPVTGQPITSGTFNTPMNGTGGNIKGVELAASLPLKVLTRYLDGFGVVANVAQNASSVSIPNTTDNNAGGNMALPGLSKRTANLTVYYEKNGFSARAAETYRSDFIGEVATNTGDRQLTFVEGTKVLDLQFGYEFQSGPLKNLSLLVQMNNVSNSHFKRYRDKKDNVIEDRPLGRTVLFGLNYKM